MATQPSRVVVVGAGVAGLVTAAILAHRGCDVTVLERAPSVGGKMREVVAGGRVLDTGPTVLTMPWVFEELFTSLGERLADHVELVRIERLARHAFLDGSVLDLFSDVDRSADAVARFAGPAEADGYRRFCAYAQRIHATVEGPFLRSDRPGALDLLRAAHRLGMPALGSIDAHRTLWGALGGFFRDPRLRQLFGRYATYCGSSPFLAPATLNVIAHVEREGVYLVRGGMARLGGALAALAARAGARVRTQAHVAEIMTDGTRATGVRLADGERIGASVVVMNGDVEALAHGMLGQVARRAAPAPRPRSLSAITWAMVTETRGFPLVRHNVFFSSDYETEFDELFRRGRVPHEPTVYVCAQDRDGEGEGASGPERLLLLVNAPPTGDAQTPSRWRRRPDIPQANEVQECEERATALMERMGLCLGARVGPVEVTTPSDLERLFPGTGGALYGAASHGMLSALRRSRAQTRVLGIYLCGGSVHPGAGVPMAALSGRLAAHRVIADLASTSRSRPVAMPGGISMS